MNCPYCKVKMEKIRDLFGAEQIEYDLFRCPRCKEGYLSMEQLKELGEKHKAWRKASKTTFSKWGNSWALRIPKQMAIEMHIKRGTTALLKRERNGFLVMPMGS